MIHQMKAYISPQFIQMLILIYLFHFYFSANDFSLNTVPLILKFCRDVKNITVEGTVIDD